MKTKKLGFFILISLFIVLSLNFIKAEPITGAIGNGVTVIPRQNVPEGEEVIIDRELIVINKNNFVVNVTLEVGKEIEDIIELIDEEFSIEANKEKRARFKIILEDNYVHSGKIHVFFVAPDSSRIVLASKLTILGDSVDGSEDNEEDIEEDIEVIDDENLAENEESISFSVGGSSIKNKNSDNSSLGVIILVLILIVIVGGIVGFIVLIRR